jgi:hypothetical protein
MSLPEYSFLPMKKTVIFGHQQLTLQILQLKADKFIQEEELKETAQDFMASLTPATLFKKSFQELAKDKEVQLDLAKVGLTLSANLIIDRALGKHKSVKGLLNSLLAENAISTFIKKNGDSIVSGIKGLIHKKPTKEFNQL